MGEPSRGRVWWKERRAIAVMAVVVIAMLAASSSLYLATRPDGPEVNGDYFVGMEMNDPSELKFDVVSQGDPWDSFAIRLSVVDPSDSPQSWEWRPPLGSLVDDVTDDDVRLVSESIVDGEITCTITDLAGDGLVSGGDYFEFTPREHFTIGHTYLVALIYVPVDEPVAFASFTWMG